jgi:hypothetical protein
MVEGLAHMVGTSGLVVEGSGGVAPVPVQVRQGRALSPKVACMDEPAQPAEPRGEAKRAGGFASYIAWGFVLVVAYLLSAGPATRVTSLYMAPYPAYMASPGASFYFFAPWRYAYWRTPIHKPLGMYMHLWLPEVFSRNGDFRLV